MLTYVMWAAPIIYLYWPNFKRYTAQELERKKSRKKTYSRTT